MNIITGINKFWVASFGLRVKTCLSSNSETNKGITNNHVTRNTQLVTRNSKLVLLFLTLIFGACASHQAARENEVSARSDVKVSSPVMLPASLKLNYMAVTRYLQSNDIRTQVTGIVRQINCSVASNVIPKQALFIIQPQEAAALQKSKFNTQILKGLSDTVYAHLSGQIKNLNVQAGDFVQSGDVLATCIRNNSMRIIVYVPVEKAAMVAKVKNCKLILPDGSTVGGRVSGKLPAAESQDQTEAYIVEPSKLIPLAENINLDVQFTAEQIQDALFVPESAVLGNEEQTSFWVMKLMNDSTCVKVPVEKGLEQDSLIQVIGNELTTNDKVITEGGYGLADSARVQIINME